jgi:hypothetical protein
LILIFGLLGIAYFFVYFSEKFKVEGEKISKAMTAMIINLLFKLTAFATVALDLFMIRNVLPSITNVTSMYDAMLPIFVYGVGLIFFLTYIVNSIITLLDNFQVFKSNQRLKKEREDNYDD